MHGWLIVNHFLQTTKFKELYAFFCAAARQYDIELSVKTGAELLPQLADGIQIDEALPDFGLFWDKDIRLGVALEAAGLRLFNSSCAVELCDDKSLTHLTLTGKIPMPQTICAPMTYAGVGYGDLGFVHRAVQTLGLPLVIKECFGSFGSQVYLAHTAEEAEKTAARLAGRPFVMQRYIKSSHGRDVRLQVVGKTVIAAMLRHNESGDFRANISGGGEMEPYRPTDEQQTMAVSACSLLGLDFGGVDLLFGEHEKPILCEVNSNAHFKNLYDCTGVNTAEAIMRHIRKTMEG